jgi:hypothetical protein
MKTLLLVLSLLSVAPAMAENIVGGLLVQTAQVMGETGTPTSCRLYRKRVELFLQRVNEAAAASAVREDRMSTNDTRRVLDLLQRADVPLELLKENILWTLDFDTRAAGRFFELPPVLVELNSTYLQWQTDQGLFPDHIALTMKSDMSVVRMTYKMTYMEACLAPVNIALRMTNHQGDTLIMQTQLNRNLL